MDDTITESREPDQESGNQDGFGTPHAESKPEPRNKKSGLFKGCMWFLVLGGLACFAFGVLGLFFLFGIGALAENLSTFELPMARPAMFNQEYVYGNERSRNRIRIIDVEGIILQEGSTIYQTATASLIRDQLRAASENPEIRGIVLSLNTPGGEVVASDIIHQEIRYFRETTGLPVVAAMGSMAASGGYYIAVACDHIVANRLTLTGSIGVIIGSYDYYELFDKIGVQARVFKSGKMKDMLDGSKRKTPMERAEEDAIVQALVNETYLEFVRLVAEGRNNLTAETITGTEIGDGRIFTGAQAHALGLVDEIGFLEDAVGHTAKTAGIGDDYQVVRFRKPFTFSSLFSAEANARAERNLSVTFPGAGNVGWQSAVEPGKLYFLPSF
jgi:protease-4